MSHSSDRVEQSVRVYPQSGWPGVLEATIVHSVGDSGVVTEVRATNLGDGPVPFGYASHPYLTVGEDTVDDVVISVPAERYLAVDDRLLPLDLILVEGRDEDLREAAPLGARRFDTALTGLQREPTACGGLGWSVVSAGQSCGPGRVSTGSRSSPATTGATSRSPWSP